MRKYYCFIGIILLSIVMGCKKDHQSQQQPVPKVKSITTGSGLLIEKEYDSKGRLTSTKIQGHVRTILIYNNNTAVERNMNDAGVVTDTVVYTLRPDGLATSVTFSNSSATTSYQYNSSGQIAKDTKLSSGGTTEYIYHYSSGNADSISTIVNGQWFGSVVNEYYTDKVSTLEGPNNGYVFLGKGNLNPRKKTIEKYSTGSVNESNYTYEYDSQNRIIKSTITDAGSGTTSVTTYTYQ
jgi:YD repeat-containing protein